MLHLGKLGPPSLRGMLQFNTNKKIKVLYHHYTSCYPFTSSWKGEILDIVCKHILK